MSRTKMISGALLALAAFALPAGGARADIVLSELIVELHPGDHAREDVEIWNRDKERAYVAVEPAEIVDPGRPDQSRREDPDPEKLGLLVAPARMILEPGQRKLVRIATLGADTSREHVYRVTVKPVAGPLHSDASGLKVLVGYDLLVLVRPAVAHPAVTGTRNGNSLTLRNDGNASVELTHGRQCDSTGQKCAELPGKRLYAGADWTETLPGAGTVEYSVKSPAGPVSMKF
jgi:P pilus assembly chaperone PapD